MITQEELKKMFSYCPATGYFTRIIGKQGGGKKGSIVGLNNKKRYLEIHIGDKFYLAHRLAWLYMFGEFPKNDIDHINRDKKDNKISNLRDVTRSVNIRNLPKNKRNKTGVNGVYFCNTRNKYVVTINKSIGVQSAIKAFENLEDAKECRLKLEVKHGYSENHGK